MSIDPENHQLLEETNLPRFPAGSMLIYWRLITINHYSRLSTNVFRIYVIPDSHSKKSHSLIYWRLIATLVPFLCCNRSPE